MSNPKLFISYSWSNPDHESKVIQLAEELSESGIHVILDKWDLKEGHDSVAFMEKMVTDPDIKKVAIISDKLYAERADGRSGGVGTETQIISREVYENQEQDKFVAIITERDENGKPYLPTYYKSRIYIDLSTSENYADNFEKLLRWIYNKPLYIRPEIGSKPAFLNENNSISLGTTTSFRRALSAVKEYKPFASGAIDDYFSIFIGNMERYRIVRNESEFDNLVIESIEQFIPYRNEMISLLTAIAQYRPEEEYIVKIHRLFESMIPFMSRPETVMSYYETDFDNFKFIIHELFLYFSAIMLKYERFDELDLFLKNQYYITKNTGYTDNGASTGYEVFRQYVESLEHRNNRLQLRRLSLHADLLHDRATGTGLDFRYVMQADFVLYLRSLLHAMDEYSGWYPTTLLYAANIHHGFEIFARASSKMYFDKMKSVLGITQLSELASLIDDSKNGKVRIPRWEMTSIHLPNLSAFKHLATRS